MIRYKCLHCGTMLETNNQMGGNYEACPVCGKLTPVPQAQPTVFSAHRNIIILGGVVLVVAVIATVVGLSLSGDDGADETVTQIATRTVTETIEEPVAETAAKTTEEPESEPEPEPAAEPTETIEKKQVEETAVAVDASDAVAESTKGPKAKARKSKRKRKSKKSKKVRGKKGGASDRYRGREWDVFYYLCPNIPRKISMTKPIFEFNVMSRNPDQTCWANVRMSVLPQKRATAKEIVSLFGEPDWSREEGQARVFLRKKGSRENWQVIKGPTYKYGPFILLFDDEEKVAYITARGRIRMEELGKSRKGLLGKMKSPATFTRNVFKEKPEILAINTTPAKIELSITPESSKEGEKTILQPFERKKIPLEAGKYYDVTAGSKNSSGRAAFRISRGISVVDSQVWTFSIASDSPGRSPRLEWTFGNTASEMDQAKSDVQPSVRPVCGDCPLPDGLPAQVRCVSDLPAGISALAATPDGKGVLVGCRDGSLRMVDVVNGKTTRELNGSTGGITSLAFSPDGRLAASGDADGGICIWDVAEGKDVRRWGGHPGRVASLAFLPDGRQLASGGADAKAILWNVESGEADRTFGPFDAPVCCVGPCEFGQFLRIMSAKFTQYDYLSQLPPNALDKPHRQVETKQKTAVHCAAIGGDGGFILAGLDSGGMVYRYLSNQLRYVVFGKPGRQQNLPVAEECTPADQYSAVAGSSDGRWGVAGTEEGSVLLRSVNRFRWFGQFRGHAGKITALAFSPDDRFVFSGGNDRTVRIWRLPRESKTFTDSNRHVHAVSSLPTTLPAKPFLPLKSVTWKRTGKKHAISVLVDKGADLQALACGEGETLALCLCRLEKNDSKTAGDIMAKPDLMNQPPFFLILPAKGSSDESVSYVRQSFNFKPSFSRRSLFGEFLVVYHHPQLNVETLWNKRSIRLNLDPDVLAPGIELGNQGTLAAAVLKVRTLPGEFISNVVQTTAPPRPMTTMRSRPSRPKNAGAAGPAPAGQRQGRPTRRRSRFP